MRAFPGHHVQSGMGVECTGGAYNVVSGSGVPDVTKVLFKG